MRAPAEAQLIRHQHFPPSREEDVLVGRQLERQLAGVGAARTRGHRAHGWGLSRTFREKSVPPFSGLWDRHDRDVGIDKGEDESADDRGGAGHPQVVPGVAVPGDRMREVEGRGAFRDEPRVIDRY